VKIRIISCYEARPGLFNIISSMHDISDHILGVDTHAFLIIKLFFIYAGAVCLSTLGLIFPAIIELVTYWERPGMGKYNWRIYKNAFLIIFGVVGFITGTYVSIHEMMENE
jgi:hypothetical protein